MSSKFTSAGKTDIGLVRSGNEDSLKIIKKEALFIVCDGMGGHLGGEVASKEGCEVVADCFTRLSDEISPSEGLKLPADFTTRGDLLVKAIRIANRSIYLKASARNDLAGMGTTIVAATFEDDLIHIAHVGDSRLYRMTEDKLIQMTTDHSWVSELQQTGALTEKEAANFSNRNIITRALGVKETVEIDYRCDKVKAGEIYIICSDGLCGFADDDEIYSVARECRGDLNLIVDNLVQLANDHGGTDNVTVVAFRVDAVGEKSSADNVEPVTIPNESSEVLLEQDRLIEKLVDIRTGPQEKTVKIDQKSKPKPKSKESRLPIVLIFIFFVVIVAIIYFTMVK